MAKKTTKTDTAEKTTTYSTRLSDEHRALVEEASNIFGVSASKFIRDAAIRAALDAINAQGDNDAAITSSMHALTDTLKNPKVTVKLHSQELQHSTERTISISNAYTPLDNLVDVDGNQDISFDAVGVRGKILTEKQIDLLRDIALNCPITFGDAFRRALDGADTHDIKFTPRASPQPLNDD